MSSNVQDVERDGDDLIVTFKGGARYRYYGVPDEVYVEYRRADSKGTFVATKLRNRFRTQRLDEGGG